MELVAWLKVCGAEGDGPMIDVEDEASSALV